MTKKGSELEFISRIERDGSGVVAITDQKEISHTKNETFNLMCLSLTKETYIACEFNCYVVKIKQK